MEWIPEAVGSVITTAVGFWVIWYLTKSADRKVPRGSNRAELRMNKLYLACGIIGVVLGIASFALLFSEDFHGQRTFLGLLATMNALMFLGMGMPCTMYYRNHRVILSDLDFIVIDVWGDLYTCGLGEVEKIEFKKWTGLFHLKTKSGARLKVHSHLIGVTGFLDVVRERSHLGSK
jgi:hypothetical protein